MAVIWFLLMQVFGLIISYSVMKNRAFPIKTWLGSVFGSVLAIWTPIPFAFFMGFSGQAHTAALTLAAAIALAAVVCGLMSGRQRSPGDQTYTGIGFGLLFGAYMLLAGVILLSHTIAPDNGALYTGQCTYGDMSMHLGFVTSLAVQQTFPPQYSILPGAKLCYPFLCDSISASLYLLGLPLRAAYILPMLFAFMQVFCGVWFLACELCREKHAPALSAVLFFLCGGFGTVYFFEKYSFAELFGGFYKTPTNLTEEGIRWVNVIADMLIPQRATLFGWSVLFACLYLLYRAVFNGDRRAWLPAGILGGLLPMIHTHSYFALGLTAFCWLVFSLFRDGLNLRWFGHWCLFGLPAVLLAVPQLLEWTLQSVGGNDSFLRFGFDWVNGGRENIALFWLKNIGPMLIIIPIALFFSTGTQRAACSGAVLIFALGEFVLFQPNPYDNNKLFYVGYLFFCMVGADFILRALAAVRFRPARYTAAGLVLLLCTNAAVLTLAREVVSGLPDYRYMLVSKDAVEAAEYINSNARPDALVLTASNHNNAVAVLTGRNILCGSPSYLYYHGLDYTAMLERENAMFADAEEMKRGIAELGIDFVFVSPAERALGNGEKYLAQNCSAVFTSPTVTVYKVR